MMVLMTAERAAAEVTVSASSKVDPNPGEVVFEGVAGDDLVAIHTIPKGATPLQWKS